MKDPIRLARPGEAPPPDDWVFVNGAWFVRASTTATIFRSIARRLRRDGILAFAALVDRVADYVEKKRPDF